MKLSGVLQIGQGASYITVNSINGIYSFEVRGIRKTMYGRCNTFIGTLFLFPDGEAKFVPGDEEDAGN